MAKKKHGKKTNKTNIDNKQNKQNTTKIKNIYHKEYSQLNILPRVIIEKVYTQGGNATITMPIKVYWK